MFIRNEHEEQGARGLFTRRAAVLTLVQAVGFSALAARLYQLQVMEENRYAPLAETNRITMHALAPIRGLIYDRSGRVLADNIEAFRLVLTPSLAGDVRTVLRAVGEIIDLDAQAQEAIYQRSRRQSVNLPLVVAANLNFDQVARFSVLAPQMPGLETELVGERRYFNGEVMGHLIGHVGSVARFALDDDPILRLPGMRVGKIGVELGREEALRGVGGYVKREIDARGRVVRDLERKDPERGRDLVLTVDTELQQRFLNILSKERRGAAVAIDVETGEIAAMASWPTADITVMADGISQKEWDELTSKPDDPMFNRSIRGLYPPGSTFKMITALAALEDGVIDLRERVTCSGTMVYFDQKFRCWNRGGHGACDLHRAIRESCDVYFYEVARRVGITKIADMAERFGLGQEFEEAGIAHQKAGVIPTPSWKRGRFGRRWVGGETLLAGIGQGYVSTTPMQLAVMTARLATGRIVEPTLIANGDSEPRRPFRDIGIDPEHLKAVQKAMRAVVNEGGGTGKRAQLPGGNTVAGKTGTSQVTRLSSERSQERLPWKFRDHALFVGYFPAEAPRYAVSVVVEHGGSGGKSAAPMARALMQELIAFDEEAKPVFEIGRGQRGEPGMQG